jgi:uncharacterized integral membrane protein (TIGR00698 family)
MLAALPLADWLGHGLLAVQGVAGAAKSSPISGVPVAIVLGLVLRNTLGLPAQLAPGVKFCVAKLLRLGIILVGIKLTLLDVARLGAWGVPIAAATIATGLVAVIWLARRAGLPSELATLLAAGTSICGVTAVVSTAPVIKAGERDVAYAVATVTIFGLVAMLAYPHLAPLLLETPEQIGVFFGTAVQDTSQVVGAALTYTELHHDDTALKAATVMKLTRNLFLLLVVPLLALLHARGSQAESARRVSFAQLVPLFILGFVAMAVVRTMGDATAARGLAFGLLEPARWSSLTALIGEDLGARYLLGTAMAAVGLSTSVSVFRTAGLRPLLVGFAGALLVGSAGLAMARLLAARIHL